MRNAVQNNLLSAPNQKSFTRKSWNDYYQSIVDPSQDDTNFYQTGLIFDNIFSSIRNTIKLNNKSHPKCTNEYIVKWLCAISIRSRISLQQQDEDIGCDNLNINSPKKYEASHGELVLPPEEIAENIVDSIELAIKNRLRDINKKNSSNNPSVLTKFLEDERNYSEMYSIYEYYWQGYLWGNYDVIISEEKLVIRQKVSEENIKYLASLNRKNRELYSYVDTIKNNYRTYFDDRVVCFQKDRLKVVRVGDLTLLFQYQYCLYQLNRKQILDSLPPNILLKNFKNQEFNLIEVLDLFLNINILSAQIQDEYCKRDIDYINDDPLDCLPIFKKHNLVKCLSKSTNLSYQKCYHILELLTIGPTKRCLWAYPLIPLRKNFISILLSSTVTPNLRLVVDYWLRDYLDDEIEQKGYKFEDKVIEVVNNSLKAYKYSKDVDLASKKTISIDNHQEEIDCIFRFGEIIAVCESKSIVSIDSELSIRNTKRTLNKAAKQIKRKVDFLTTDWETVFHQLGWVWDNFKTYKAIPIIVNSNGMFASCSFLNIPVVDEHLLANYFDSNISPLFSENSNNHRAWFELYSNFQEAQLNFEKYLFNIPLVIVDCKFIENFSRPSSNTLINIKTHIEIQTLMVRPHSIEDVLSLDYPFPLKKV